MDITKVIAENRRTNISELAKTLGTPSNLTNCKCYSASLEAALLRLPMEMVCIDASTDTLSVFKGESVVNMIKMIRRDEQFDGFSFFPELNGKKFSEFPVHLQRRVMGTEVMVYTIVQAPALEKDEVISILSTF